ncbi:RICIN domain-containing protein [Arthrobacter sp. ISL-69]|nr:RICIN domain-containing protein [Arthrobacter sp. ISL-69]
MLAGPVVAAQAYAPEGGILYQLPDNEKCLKGRGNCAVYPKSAQLPSGRLVAAFEKSTVVASSGAATGQTMPIYKSEDDGTSWQPLAEVKAPAYLSSDPQYAKYTSNWTNPYLYTLPENVGNLTAGTLLLATVVSGEDRYYTEHKAADPNWVPTNDGDRQDMAIALYSSIDDGATWKVVNVIATGGWQGGSAGATGVNVAKANTYRQVDPVWEPYLMVHNGMLVAYYSDENEYLGYDPATGVPVLDPDNDTAEDPHTQILAHKTWDGSSAAWSAPVVDIAGKNVTSGAKTYIGGGRPGMTNVVPTTDGKWFITYEYWGGGADVRFKMANDPLKFYADGDVDGEEISRADGKQGLLPFASGSRGLSWGGSPVVINLPDGRLVYNASGSGSVWVDESGRSDGVWTRYQTPLGGGYSRNLQYVKGTGQVHILQGTWGGATAGAIIRHADVDLGHSKGAYYRLINRKTGQIMGTGGNTTDANIGNADIPDVRLEDLGATPKPDTQYWHLVTKADGKSTLLNKAGGREAAIWTGNATIGQRIGQWVDNTAGGLWNVKQAPDGYYTFQAAKNTSAYLTGASAGAPLTLQNATTDGSQQWQLVKDPATATAPKVTSTVTGAVPNAAGWRSGLASVSLTLNEGAQAGIEYRLGEGEWQPYTAPVQVFGDGETILSYRAVVNGVAVENSGGAETIRIDATAPTVALVGGPTGDYTFGHDAAAPTCDAADAVSGLASCAVTGGGSAVGEHAYTATATDNAGNVSTADLTYTVLPWTVTGFTAPVDMAGVWNTVKGGSTVPFKFELFDGATELTDLTKVRSFTSATVACPGPGTVTDEIETVTTDVAGLTYEDGYFQQNWKTPKRAASCLQVTMTAQDETKLTANFILK